MQKRLIEYMCTYFVFLYLFGTSRMIESFARSYYERLLMALLIHFTVKRILMQLKVKKYTTQLISLEYKSLIIVSIKKTIYGNATLSPLLSC